MWRMRSILISDFKTHCVGILRDLQAEGGEVVPTSQVGRERFPGVISLGKTHSASPQAGDAGFQVESF